MAAIQAFLHSSIQLSLHPTTTATLLVLRLIFMAIKVAM